MKGSDEEKISAATVLCGASIIRGWNIQVLHFLSLVDKVISYECSLLLFHSNRHTAIYKRVHVVCSNIS